MQKNKSIPVTDLDSAFSGGIIINRTSSEELINIKDVERSHRDAWHLFCLQEKGTTAIEIDFQQYEIQPASIIYIHPNQVHRIIKFKNAVISSWFISNDNLKPEYCKLLEEISQLNTLSLDEETFSIIYEAVSLCIKLSERKNEKLYRSLLMDGCNTLVGLVASQFLMQATSTDKFSRADIITKSFKSALERDFATIKNPAAYAKSLNISTPYLNECVKNTTGHSVSHHIQQRNILEAKRLLYHSDKSVKEITSELGYNDTSYFSRLFVKVTGMAPLVFRSKNLD